MKRAEANDARDVLRPGEGCPAASQGMGARYSFGYEIA